MVNQLISLIHENHYNIKILRWKRSNVSGFRKAIARNCEIMFDGSGFQETCVHTACSNNSRGRIEVYLRKHLKVIRKQMVALDKAEDLIFRSVPKNSRPDEPEFQ